MTRRANPRPAFVDHFAALLIAGFGGFIMLAGAYQQESLFSEDAAQKIRDRPDQTLSLQLGFKRQARSLGRLCFPRLRVGAAELSDRGHRPADSQPFPGCDRVKPDCYDRNRRTTLRLRADTPQIETRHKQQTQSIQ